MRPRLVHARFQGRACCLRVHFGTLKPQQHCITPSHAHDMMMIFPLPIDRSTEMRAWSPPLEDNFPSPNA